MDVEIRKICERICITEHLISLSNVIFILNNFYAFLPM